MISMMKCKFSIGRKRPSISNRRITGEHRHRVKPMNVASRFLKKKCSIPSNAHCSRKKAIEQRAAALGISASELVRRSAIYGKIESFNFDIAEVEKLHHELLKEGTNLNQLMYFVNAQGLPAYNEKAVFRTLEKVYQNARKVDRFIEKLEKRYHVDYIPRDYLADEPDNRNL